LQGLYQARKLRNCIQRIGTLPWQLEERRLEWRGHGRHSSEGGVDHSHVGRRHCFGVAIVHIQNLKLPVAEALQNFTAVKTAIDVEQTSANVPGARSCDLRTKATFVLFQGCTYVSDLIFIRCFLNIPGMRTVESTKARWREDSSAQQSRDVHGSVGRNESAQT
jgi:hypothetical protein